MASIQINKESMMETLSKFKEGDKYVLSKDDLLRIINENTQKTKKTTKKRKMSSYFIWLNENRQKITEEYFSDFKEITDWSYDSKKEYYESRGLSTEKVAENDKRPRIVALITMKAGIIWKSMSDEEKQVYEDKAKEQKDEVVEEKENEKEVKPKKKGRGRPKKEKEVKQISQAYLKDNEASDNNESDDEDEDEVSVSEVVFEGKTYWHDDKSDKIYDPASEECVGKMVKGKVVLDE